MAREAREGGGGGRDRDRRSRRRRRHHRQAGHHQPRRQGGEGRPSLRLRRAGGGRRPEGPRRLRRRQGARGAGGDPQGDRARQARHDPRADEGRPHAAPRRRGPLRRRQRGAAHRRRPAPASSPAARCARCSRRWASATWWRSRSAAATRTTWSRRPSPRCSAAPVPRSVATRRGKKVSELFGRREATAGAPPRRRSTANA